MFVYNPLNTHTELYALYESASGRDVAAPPDAELVLLYKPYSGGGRGASAGPRAALKEDSRELTVRFGRFFSTLIEHTNLLPEVAALPVVFPQVLKSDARCVAAGGHQVVFVTSGMLDAIELFANTVSACARLNELALPALAEVEDQPPEKVPLAWLTLTGDAIPGMTVGGLLEREAGADQVNAALFEYMDWAAQPLWPGLARYRLSHYLMQLMMRAIRRSVHEGWGGARGYSHERPSVPLPIDRQYLETLALAFVVLHELGHLALGHNEIGFRGRPDEVGLADGLLEATRGIEGEVIDFTGKGASFELAADVFAVEVVEERVREPMLEAASLWCAALERSRAVTGERSQDLVRMAVAPDMHPSHALRVWNLNGRLSSGPRKGSIARQIASFAESAAAELDEGDDRPALEAEVFGTLWQLARPAMADDRAWKPPVRPAPAPVQRLEGEDVLELGLRAWNEGRLDRAEELFREAARSGAADVSGQAHGLVGRMLEEGGDTRGAEAEYRRGDALGDGDAANDLGVLLEDRGKVAEAEAAYRRADERGNSPAAYNIAQLFDRRGERDAAIAAMQRADARGHAQAALHLGHLAFDAGETDRAEAAWRRADARGATGAATNLGVLLHQRGDLGGAEAAWRRGAERGEVDALHNLGNLLEERGDLDEARNAYAQAVAHGRSGSAGNLRALALRLRDLESREAALRRGAREGDAEAAYQLGFLLLGRRDLPGAVEAWERAERLGHSRAASELGLVLDARGDAEGAEEAFRRGAARGHARAAFNLGVRLHERGDDEGAIAQWRRADAMGDPLAATNLGSMLEFAGDSDGAIAAYGRADERGDALGATRLGRLLEGRSDLDGAEAAYRRADERGDPHGSGALGELLSRRGDVPGAEDAWRRADARGNRDAAYNLGLLLRRLGNLDGAEAAFRRAAERGKPSSMSQLALVLAAKGHQQEAAEALMTPSG